MFPRIKVGYTGETPLIEQADMFENLIKFMQHIECSAVSINQDVGN